MLLRHLVIASVFMGLVRAQGATDETVVSKRINSQNRLVPLKKVTVGPDDQYQGMMDSTGKTLIFTRKSDLVPHLCRQDSKTGEVNDFLPLNADSQEAAISSTGLVAFTYYKFNARGDICYRPIEGPVTTEITCLKGPDGEKSSPFWKSEEELAYVVRDMKTLSSQIISENIKTNARQTLVEGKVWSPGMKIGGKYLFYNQLVEDKNYASRNLTLKDLSTGKTKVIRFMLPGIAGFPAVSADEKSVFFSQYLNDSNNDNIIDGKDNSVIFRASIDSLLQQNEVFPEELTSIESNCSFPRPTDSELFVTCAFEGALDIYRLPLSGVIPPQWDEKLLWNAHQTARTYQERILILNTLRFRSQSTDKVSFDERIFGDHLLADDIAAAQFYLRKVQEKADAETRDFLSLVSLYLRAREQKKAQPANEVSLAFQRSLAGIGREIDKGKGHARFRSILHGMLATFVNQPAQALRYFKQVKFNTPARPLERNLYLELAQATNARVKGVNMAEVYSQAMSAPELPNEGQIYYAFQFLRYLQDSKMSRKERIALLSKPPAGVSEGVASLLKSEAATLKIIEGTETKQKDEAYRELDGFMSKSRADYYLRKALYVRAILNFVDAMEFKYLNFVATNWLRYTAMEDTEFAYARDVYVNATLDRAYDTFAQKQYELAGNYFYGSLSLTDDLESHYGYVKSMTLRGQRKTVDERYQNLVNRKFILDNMKFVEALLILIDKRPDSREDTSSFDKAIEKLLTMEQDRDSAVRYLLLGSCYLEKLLRTSDGYDFNAELFESAHHNLMLAYDLGRDNDRIEASALTNLGLLHQRVQNGGLAARFFGRRRELGFTSREEHARFTWFYAKALFYADQPDKSAEEIARVLSEAPNAPAGSEKLSANVLGPLSERLAFYLHASRNYEEAASQYRKLIDAKTIQGDLNLAKAQLAYGYSLFKLGREQESRSALSKAIEHASRLNKIEKGKDRLIDFQPIRISLNAYGLLSRLGTPVERVQALVNRKALLEEGKALFEDYQALAIQNRVQLGYWLSKTDGNGSAENLREALEFSEALGEAKQYLSHAIFQAASGYMAQALKNPDPYRKFGAEKIQSVVEKSLKAYDAQKAASPALAYQKAKLRMLWSAYDAKVVRNQKPSETELKKLAEETPSNAKRLVPLAEALAR